MKTLDYIAPNQEELFAAAPEDIQKLILGDEVNSATAVLGKIYKLPVSSYVALENIITFLLIGALKPEDAVRGIMDILDLPEDIATNLAADLDRSILEKARIRILGKGKTDMVELTFQEGRSADDLRKEILDTTKRESPLVKPQSSAPTMGVAETSLPVIPAEEPPIATSPLPETPKDPAPAPVEGVAQSEIPNTANQGKQAVGAEKKVVVAPGSRSQLLEQLQILDTIPDDDEVAERLAKIQSQISSMGGTSGEEPTSQIPLQNYMLGDKADETISPDLKPATYSKAPTKYNVDPYREQVEG